MVQEIVDVARCFAGRELTEGEGKVLSLLCAAALDSWQARLRPEVTPEQVRDLSEYTDSVKKPAGIRHVLVGGTFALKDGAATGSRTGTVLKKV